MNSVNAEEMLEDLTRKKNYFFLIEFRSNIMLVLSRNNSKIFHNANLQLYIFVLIPKNDLRFALKNLIGQWKI